MWYISSMEYYSATKRNEIGSPVEKWIDLESVIQSQDQYFLRYDISLYRLLAFPFRIGSRFLSIAYRILHNLALPPWLTSSPAILLLHHSHISLLVISQPDSLFPASESLHLLFPLPVFRSDSWWLLLVTQASVHELPAHRGLSQWPNAVFPSPSCCVLFSL